MQSENQVEIDSMHLTDVTQFSFFDFFVAHNICGNFALFFQIHSLWTLTSPSWNIFSFAFVLLAQISQSTRILYEYSRRYVLQRVWSTNAPRGGIRRGGRIQHGGLILGIRLWVNHSSHASPVVTGRHNRSNVKKGLVTLRDNLNFGTHPFAMVIENAFFWMWRLLTVGI